MRKAVRAQTPVFKMAAASGAEKGEQDLKQLKLLVFGATAATGTEVVKQGLELGHNITAIVRNPENFNLK